MIDLIIPIYNAVDTLPYTLMSIRLQSISNLVNIYLIDDFSSCSYDEIINEFKDLNITYKKLEKNSGPGVARQVGIDVSDSKYIMFMDSDDLFFFSDSIKMLYSKIEEGYDHVAGLTFYEKNNVQFYNEGDLHSKIYRRSFIEKNSIKFNKTRFHEDNFFSNLLLICDPKMTIIDIPIYIYVNNPNSITSSEWDNEFERLEILLSNMRELILEGKKRNCDKKMVLFYTAIKIKYFNRLWDKFTSEQKKIFKKWLKEYDIKLEKYLTNTNYEVIIDEICETYDY